MAVELTFTDHLGCKFELEDGRHETYTTLLMTDTSDGESANIMLNESRIHMLISTLLQSRFGKTYTVPNLYDYTLEELEDFIEQQKQHKIEEAKNKLNIALKEAYEAGVEYEDILDAAKNF
ncbi:hypothetical protein BI004_gp164 [Bacillus phage NotTheCreek]|uniref:hypothetical protein n=1 Tax=Bacillus phage NotTheCreek TaxID=1805952 RepID=UPI0007A77262|nr:hypothetical protein BI004_gp164 [Bacillus phage NotTheCreek]AMW63383.1 hypothetical protein NOTTHECREEK_164 [Bacillus phage NotTheCreek]QDH50147.1 hypothetical protein ALPS_161 [Bacillus phage ALPS]